MRLSGAQAHAYLSLLKKTLVRYPLQHADYLLLHQLGQAEPTACSAIRRWALANQLGLGEEIVQQPSLRLFGLDWPAEAETMIGLLRMENLHYCLTDILRRGVPGDLAEAGVWRGGACIFMRAVLAIAGDTRRKVWLADSFQGLPKPDADNYPADRGDRFWTYDELAVSMEIVKRNFERYGLLDQQVQFLPGWFRETLPNAPIEQLALLRLDGDMYESTIVTLRSLYHRVSPGGYVIVDDYGAVPACREAVDGFRREFGILAPVYPVDWTGVFWQVRAGESSALQRRYRLAAS